MIVVIRSLFALFYIQFLLLLHPHLVMVIVCHLLPCYWWCCQHRFPLLVILTLVILCCFYCYPQAGRLIACHVTLANKLKVFSSKKNTRNGRLRAFARLSLRSAVILVIVSDI